MRASVLRGLLRATEEKMSRSGYSDDWDGSDWELICWRGAVLSAIRGKRGQAFLRELIEALDALPGKILIDEDLARNGEVCALGAVGKKRGLEMSRVDPEDRDAVGELFGIAPALAAEIVYENDEAYFGPGTETPEHRFARMRKWAEENLKP